LQRRLTNSRNKSPRNPEQGIVILLVAVFMLFVVGAMAALSIDIVTLYTARSEAQLAADAGALAGARVLANSGVTSNRTAANAKGLATMIATQVASQNMVGGRTLNPVAAAGEIAVSFSDSNPAFNTDPHVTVQTQRTDLPTFFARIWGRTVNTVVASATAEAYNPSGSNAANSGPATPVAPLCVKPWLLPNLDPTAASATGASSIFDRTSGAITNAGLVGQEWPSATPGLNPDGIYSLCGGNPCTNTVLPAPGGYYPGAIDATDFPVPTQGLPSCSATFNSYQLAVAGCVSTPISCGSTATVNIDVSASYAANRDLNTVTAAECLIHYSGAAGDSDSIDPADLQPPFQFLGGNQNPVASAVGNAVMVSDSVVTIPVIDTPGSPPPAPSNPVTVIGFLQVFLNPSAIKTLPYTLGLQSSNEIPATIINMAGCGTSATGQPIFGNGASPVAVRLISPP
jgi:hypothetical protein